jgi:hypothetical protein
MKGVRDAATDLSLTELDRGLSNAPLESQLAGCGSNQFPSLIGNPRDGRPQLAIPESRLPCCQVASSAMNVTRVRPIRVQEIVHAARQVAPTTFKMRQ